MCVLLGDCVFHNFLGVGVAGWIDTMIAGFSAIVRLLAWLRPRKDGPPERRGFGCRAYIGPVYPPPCKGWVLAVRNDSGAGVTITGVRRFANGMVGGSESRHWDLPERLVPGATRTLTARRPAGQTDRPPVVTHLLVEALMEDTGDTPRFLVDIHPTETAASQADYVEQPLP